MDPSKRQPYVPSGRSLVRSLPGTDGTVAPNSFSFFPSRDRDFTKKIKRENMLRDGRDQHFSRFSLLPSRTHGRRKDARHYLAAAHISSPTAACEQRNPDSGNRVGEMSSTLRFHKDNLRHLSRFPDFFVTKRILSTAEGRAVEEISLGGKWWT